MKRGKGPYYANPGNDHGQQHEDDILDYNYPPEGQPGLWCQWVPADLGAAIEWDGSEKFYEAEAWMAYVIDHFLKPQAEASKTGDPQFDEFTFDHMVNGVIEAQGEDPDDIWRLVVADNEVTVEQGRVTFNANEITPQLLDAISNIVTYNWHDEKHDYETQVRDGEETSQHVFNDLTLIAAWLEQARAIPK